MAKSYLLYIKNSIIFYTQKPAKSEFTTGFSFNSEQNPYHLVNPSPWPLALSFSLLGLAGGLVLCFTGSYYWQSAVGLSVLLLLFSVYSWFSDVTSEAKVEGFHPNKIRFSLEGGIALFIISEVLFFFGIFWSYFHSGLVPTTWIGTAWPPVAVNAIDPLGLPLFNTALLLSSGITVTWAHRSLFFGERFDVIISLVFTIVYGLLFTLFQFIEYNISSFSISDTTFGTVFFLLTGFHGLHVLVGTVMLLVVLIRFCNYEIDPEHHIGFEAAIWYWHFVDFVWLLLYIFVYVLAW